MRNKHDETLAANRPRVVGGSRRRACMRPALGHGGLAVLLAAALLPPTTTLSAQTTALRCGRLIDGISAEAREIAEEKKAVEPYGSSDSGASLGDILGAALKKDNG